MATNLTTVRTVETSDGSDNRTLEVLICSEGRFWLHDKTDINFDGLEEIQDDSDTAIMDAIRDGGFEIVEDDPYPFTTIKLTGGDLGREKMMVRCRLANASSPVEVDYCDGDGWVCCQYQCADARHSKAGLIELGKELAARAVEMPTDEFDCDAESL